MTQFGYFGPDADAWFLDGSGKRWPIHHGHVEITHMQCPPEPITPTYAWVQGVLFGRRKEPPPQFSVGYVSIYLEQHGTRLETCPGWILPYRPSAKGKRQRVLFTSNVVAVMTVAKLNNLAVTGLPMPEFWLRQVPVEEERGGDIREMLDGPGDGAMQVRRFTAEGGIQG